MNKFLPVPDPYLHHVMGKAVIGAISCSPTQISSLVTLQLLTQVSHDDQLDAPKYKCAVSMDFICAISRCVCALIHRVGVKAE